MTDNASGDNSQANVSQLLVLANEMRAQAARMLAVDPVSAEAARIEADAEELRKGAIQNAIAVDLEHQKARFLKWLDEWRHHREWYRENDKAVIALSQTAQRNLILINAGAAIALLTFIGNLLVKGSDTERFVPAIAWFAAGVSLGTVTTVLSYATQLIYGHDEGKYVNVGKWFHGAAVLVGVAALGTFIGGCVVTYQAFVHESAISQQEKNLPPPRKPPANPPQPSAPVAPAKPTG